MPRRRPRHRPVRRPGAAGGRAPAALPRRALARSSSSTTWSTCSRPPARSRPRARVAGHRIIVTSRAPLHIAGEQEYPVGPLGRRWRRPAPPSPVRRSRPGGAAGLGARRGRGGRRRVCALLDGLPLGIELAAARISLLPPSRDPGPPRGRLPLPGPGPRDVPARQRTLDGAIGWSYDLLEPGQQRLLQDLVGLRRRLRCRPGGARSPASAEPDGVDVLDGIAMLADQSLVTPRAHPTAAAVRFRLLQTIQTFALDAARGRAVARRTTRRRHAEAFLALLREEPPPGHVPSSHRRGSTGWPSTRPTCGPPAWAIEAGETELALRLAARPGASGSSTGISVRRPWPDRRRAGACPAPTRRTPARLGPSRRRAASPTGSRTRVARARYYEAAARPGAAARRRGRASPTRRSTWPFTRYVIGVTRGGSDGHDRGSRRGGTASWATTRGLARPSGRGASAAWQTAEPAAAVPLIRAGAGDVRRDW